MLKGYNVKLVEPILSPDLGACLLAFEASNNIISDSFINNLSMNKN